MYNVMNTCIVFASPKLENYALLNNVKTDTKMYWILVWSPGKFQNFNIFYYLKPFLLERIMILLICCITLEEQLVI